MLAQYLNLYISLFKYVSILQMLFGPLRCEGIGLSDGEVMERLWSYLRRFGRMTKEMRPAHRTDVIVHALVCYGIQKKEKLGKNAALLFNLLCSVSVTLLS